MYTHTYIICTYSKLIYIIKTHIYTLVMHAIYWHGFLSFLLQFSSSDPSIQSLFPLHIISECIQLPLSLHFTSPGIVQFLNTTGYIHTYVHIYICILEHNICTLHVHIICDLILENQPSCHNWHFAKYHF